MVRAEFAKLRAFRALRAYMSYVPMRLTCLRAYVPSCLKLLRPYVPTSHVP